MFFCRCFVAIIKTISLFFYVYKKWMPFSQNQHIPGSWNLLCLICINSYKTQMCVFFLFEFIMEHNFFFYYELNFMWLLIALKFRYFIYSAFDFLVLFLGTLPKWSKSLIYMDVTIHHWEYIFFICMRLWCSCCLFHFILPMVISLLIDFYLIFIRKQQIFALNAYSGFFTPIFPLRKISK